VGYSGADGAEGIADDWSVRIDLTDPEPVENFAPSSWSSDHVVQLVWVPSSDLSASHYEIYYGTHSGIGETDAAWNAENDPTLANPEQYYTAIDDLVGRTTYYFRMRAMDAAGNVGQWSEEVSVTTGGILAGAIHDLTIAPVRLGEQSGDIGVQLRWSPVTHDINGLPVHIVGYRVYASTVAEFTPTAEALIGETATNNYLVRELRNQPLNSFYVVTAVTGDSDEDLNPTRIAPGTGR
jgi:hypothetical protein